MIETTKKSVLNTEIKITVWSINSLQKQVDNLWNNVRHRIPVIDFNHIEKYVNRHYFQKIKQINIKKFQNLENNCYSSSNPEKRRTLTNLVVNYVCKHT